MKNMDKYRGSEWRKWDLHLHTASSYDSKYKGEDADVLLCKALHDNNISAVAITDHFIIDDVRISHLREIAPDIVFFPGVELRTDKGANNLHVILVFSEEAEVKTLSEDFNVIMRREKAKQKDSNDTIYWTFEDIVCFAENHDGLIIIHAGEKTNGIDKEISNALPVKEAIKADIAENIHFFEVGNKKDIETYYQYVFKDVEEKPIIICSDNHDPRDYTMKENLWIKADLTFNGLKQCIYQPQERVFVGTIPPALDRANKGERVCIDSISVSRVENAKNTDKVWFQFDIPINTGLVAIIGNKGSGKSAFSDIIGQLCKCNTMEYASFLNENRFRKLPKNYADDYIATIKWKDGHEENILLSDDSFDTTIEDAQYLPQKFIEEVCNDIDNVFQKEIDKVIFSYVDRTERGSASNLYELVENRARSINMEIERIKSELVKINNIIIKLEQKKTSQYSTHITDSYRKVVENLQRHDNIKPKEVKKPEPKEADKVYQKQLSELNDKIRMLESTIQQKKDRQAYLTIAVEDTQNLIAAISQFEDGYQEIQKIIDEFVQKYKIQADDLKVKLVTPKDKFNRFLDSLQSEKNDILVILNGDEEKSGLYKQLENLKDEKEKLIATTDSEEKQYQKYLQDLSDWELARKEIVGDAETEGTLLYFESEKKYIEEQLENDYCNQRKYRESLLEQIFNFQKQLVGIYDSIYEPVAEEIKNLLGDWEDGIEFTAEVQKNESNFQEIVLSYISQRYAGIFKGKAEAQIKMDQLLRKTEFNSEESVLELVNDILKVIDEDIDQSEKKVVNKLEFYNYLFGLNYIGVSFNLKMGGRSLEELSPGERGIVLLIFYLALSKNNTPIIIDQPEDNLDNQSVYNKLVPCICAAKKKRQVIIVTHNPNIAVACDAEQIVYCHMDKNKYAVTYEAGAIENQEVKKHVVDVLEGTMPAFNLRKKKYLHTNREDLSEMMRNVKNE